jgi:hypothetical protein
MKDDYPCEIIRDLLPAYIDGLTSADTNEAVREHLQSCAECKKIYDSMRTELVIAEEAPRDVIDYMKKIRKKRRWAIIISLAVILGICLIAILSIRYDNQFWKGDTDYVATGEMVTWNSDNTFDYNGDEYVQADLWAENDIFDFNQAFTYDEKDPAFNIKHDRGFISWLFNDEGRSVMYKLDTGSKGQIYYYDMGDMLFVKKKDVGKVQKYYRNPYNYSYGIADDDMRKNKRVKIKFDAEEIAEITGYREKMAKINLRDNLKKLALYRVSRDGSTYSDTSVIRWKGHWYWDTQILGKESNSDDYQYELCYRLPDTINKKIEKAYDSLYR